MRNLLLYFFLSISFAQDTLWFRLYNTGGTERPFGKMAIDLLGNLIIVGEKYEEGIILIIKFSPSGEVIWTRIFQGEERISPKGVTVDKEGNIIIVGTYFCFKIPSSEIGTYVIKYDNDGNLLWFKKFTINSWCALLDVVCDDSSNIIACGTYNEEGSDIILIKYTPNGDTIWTKRYDLGEPLECINSLVLDKESNIIATGAIGDIDFYDLLTVKFDKYGNILWQNRLDFEQNDWGTDLVADSFNNIYVCGFVGYPFICHSVIIKYNQNGETLWTRFYREDYEDYSEGIKIDKLENILIVGTSLNNQKIAATLLIKYNFLGDTIFTRRFNFSPDSGMSGYDLILISDSNYLYITGAFHNGNNWDIYLMKLFYPSTIKEENKKITYFEKYYNEIFDITGKKIKHQKISSKGIYFLKEEKRIKKIVIY